MTEYPIAIIPLSDEDGGGFLGFAPDLPGCMSDGDTPEEALANTLDAMNEWLDLQIRRGSDIPSPGSAAEAAEAREGKLLETIRSLADYREEIESENGALKRKLAEVLALLKEDSGKFGPSVNVPKSLRFKSPKARH
ncbi:type II toxin-antitoxin system HicB family antitoxin [Aestuariivita boseongensis]|uniref:type II toxin-antitoxin system HicB family antitoxin n=1 Tax=Aestuariivita boseongensis TaxID=1470562 RepID=UPI000A8B660D|nr:type II toxin-antitoxin system HicB family antitoxin [Aestuariivita boseongensis]